MRKMDEMELHITQKGIKWSWLFLVVALFLWSIYEYAWKKTISPASILLSIQYMVYFFVVQVSKWRMGDEEGRAAMIWYVGGLVFFLLLFGLGLWWMV